MRSDLAKKETLLEVIPGTGGIITKIAQRMGITWGTVKMWIDNDVDVRKAYKEECEKSLDFAESMLMKKIREGDTGAIRFYLRSKGKARGYMEYSMNYNIDLTALPDDVLARLAQGEAPEAVLSLEQHDSSRYGPQAMMLEGTKPTKDGDIVVVPAEQKLRELRIKEMQEEESDREEDDEQDEEKYDDATV